MDTLVINSSLRVVVLNCQSVVPKKASLDNLIYCHKLNMIIGTESWLSPCILSSEVFSPDYKVIKFLGMIEMMDMEVSFLLVIRFILGSTCQWQPPVMSMLLLVN